MRSADIRETNKEISQNSRPESDLRVLDEKTERSVRIIRMEFDQRVLEEQIKSTRSSSLRYCFTGRN
jgi:hypothetical protein